jgi:uncharacterized membrane protein YphA (DoxX/SURF4 family)
MTLNVILLAMKYMRNIFFSALVFCISLHISLAPQIASAHEVYVLSPAQITQAIGMPPFNMIAVIQNNLHEFIFWAFVTILAIFCVFFISIIRGLERWIDPFFKKIRPYAPFVARVTIGLSFLAAAYYQASYGPELPLVNTYGSLTGLITVVLVVIGILTIIGLYARIAALVALVMYAIAVWFHGWYMLTYINYMGEIVVLLALGAHNWSVDQAMSKRSMLSKPAKISAKPIFIKKIQDWLAPRSFAILRIAFGISLITASVYAKVIYNNLGLFTVMQYHLDTILGFEPHFLVLGAAIIEILIGTFIILGVEIRFTALFFEFWLMQSLFFFGEVVWPHIILIGIPIALVMYGYDSNSVEGFFFRKKKYEPVL